MEKAMKLARSLGSLMGFATVVSVLTMSGFSLMDCTTRVRLVRIRSRTQRR